MGTKRESIEAVVKDMIRTPRLPGAEAVLAKSIVQLVLVATSQGLATDEELEAARGLQKRLHRAEAEANRLKEELVVLGGKLVAHEIVADILEDQLKAAQEEVVARGKELETLREQLSTEEAIRSAAITDEDREEIERFLEGFILDWSARADDPVEAGPPPTESALAKKIMDFVSTLAGTGVIRGESYVHVTRIDEALDVHDELLNTGWESCEAEDAVLTWKLCAGVWPRHYRRVLAGPLVHGETLEVPEPGEGDPIPGDYAAEVFGAEAAQEMAADLGVRSKNRAGEKTETDSSDDESQRAEIAAPFSRKRLSEHIGQRIQERRKHLGLSVAELADRMGVAPFRIESIEDGAVLDTYVLLEFCRALKCSPAYLFEDLLP